MSGKKKFQTRVESWTYLVDFWSEPRSSSETRSARAKTDRQRSMSVRTTTHAGISWEAERARSRRTFITAGSQCGRLAQRQIWDCLGRRVPRILAALVARDDRLTILNAKLTTGH